MTCVDAVQFVAQTRQLKVGDKRAHLDDSNELLGVALP